LELRETTIRPRSFDSYKDSARLLKEWLIIKNLSDIKPFEFNLNHAFEFSDYMISVKKYAGRTHNVNYFLELRETTVRPRSFDSYKDSARLLKEWLVVKNLSILN